MIYGASITKIILYIIFDSVSNLYVMWDFNNSYLTYYKDSHFKRYDCEIKICLYVACIDLFSIYFKRINKNISMRILPKISKMPMGMGKCFGHLGKKWLSKKFSFYGIFWVFTVLPKSILKINTILLHYNSITI